MYGWTVFNKVIIINKSNGKRYESIRNRALKEQQDPSEQSKEKRRDSGKGKRRDSGKGKHRDSGKGKQKYSGKEKQQDLCEQCKEKQ